MRLPDFMIIGAAKAGTTTAHACLAAHPDLFMSPKKEIEYFARDELFEAPLETYAENFAAASDHQLCAESSTMYTMAPVFSDTAKRIAEAVPDARFIYFLREPVSRAYSFYTHMMRSAVIESDTTQVPVTFEQFIGIDPAPDHLDQNALIAKKHEHLQKGPELCLAASDYLQQIAMYHQHFSTDRLLFIQFEDLMRDQSGTLRTITDWLGVRGFEETGVDTSAISANISADAFAKIASAKRTMAAKDRLGPIWMLKALIPDRLREGLKTALFNSDSRKPTEQIGLKPMRPETRATLADRFHADIPELERITGLDLSHWRSKS